MENMTCFNGIKWVATTLDGKTIELPDNDTVEYTGRYYFKG